MQTVSINWQHSFELGAALAVTGGALALSKNDRLRWVGAFLRETAVIGFLYGLWHLAGTISLKHTGNAYHRAEWIYSFDRHLPLPPERTVQEGLLHSSLLTQAANLYYATMHFTIMLVFLIWLFVRHRDQYRPVRQVMAWTTLFCLAIQLYPVAPPRMLTDHGFVDTAMLFHQSVYSNGFAADQLSAMPSVHVAWAVLVGYYVWKVSPSRWRWIGPAHSVVTVLVVVSTGNHWWLDGIVATAVLAMCAWGVFGVRTGWHTLKPKLVSAGG